MKYEQYESGPLAAFGTSWLAQLPGPFWIAAEEFDLKLGSGARRAANEGAVS